MTLYVLVGLSSLVSFGLGWWLGQRLPILYDYLRR
jgi:hypothetical protein